MRRPSGAIAKCSLEEAPAKHKIREASHSRASCLPPPSFLVLLPKSRHHHQPATTCKTQTKLFNGAAKMTKMRCQQTRRHFICSTATSGGELSSCCCCCGPLLSLAAVWQAKSCKLMATGAHSKRFHYCHKLWPAPLPPEIALKNSAEYFSISAP